MLAATRRFRRSDSRMRATSIHQDLRVICRTVFRFESSGGLAPVPEAILRSRFQVFVPGWDQGLRVRCGFDEHPHCADQPTAEHPRALPQVAASGRGDVPTDQPDQVSLGRGHSTACPLLGRERVSAWVVLCVTYERNLLRRTLRQQVAGWVHDEIRLVPLVLEDGLHKASVPLCQR